MAIGQTKTSALLELLLTRKEDKNMRRNAITLAKNLEAIFARAQSEGADMQCLDSVLSTLCGCVMDGPLIKLTEYVFTVYGGLVSPIPRNITPEIRIQQIENDFKALEKQAVVSKFSKLDDYQHSSEHAKRVAKRKYMKMEVYEFSTLSEATKLFERSDAYADGYQSFFSGENKLIQPKKKSISFWEEGQNDAIAFSKSGHKFMIGDYFKILFNDFWNEYQVTHSEIGMIEVSKDFSEAMSYCD